MINLASYTSRTFAAKKKAEFGEDGVAVEQVQAQVNGGMVCRLRVPGFESFRAQLGLTDTWVARR